MKKLIQIIHIARNQLALDDDTYRALLAVTVPGKTSCRDMTDTELKRVIHALEIRGFKSQPAVKRRRLSSPSAISKKIRAIWHTMFNQGFIRDNSDIALDRFVQRQTRLRNGGSGVASLSWLRGNTEDLFLETLKQWHIREMKKKLKNHGIRLPESHRTGEEYRDYDTLCAFYTEASGRWNNV